MPAWLAAFAAVIGPIVVNALSRVALAFGIGFVVYSGLDVALDQVKSVAMSSYGSLPANVVQMLGLLRVDQALNLILSAVSVRFVLEGLTGGGLRKMVFKTPPV